MKTIWKMAGVLLALTPVAAAHAQPTGPDWSAVPKSEITLFILAKPRCSAKA